MIKSGGKTGADYAIYMGEIINGYKHPVGKPTGKGYLAELGHDRRVLLKPTFNNGARA
jgi:hypothetical protein